MSVNPNEQPEPGGEKPEAEKTPETSQAPRTPEAPETGEPRAAAVPPAEPVAGTEPAARPVEGAESAPEGALPSPEPAAGAGGAPDGRRRLADALWPPRVTRAQLVVALLLACLGFGLAIQVSSTSEGSALRGARQEDLVRILDELDDRTQRLEDEKARLEKQRWGGGGPTPPAAGGRPAARAAEGAPRVQPAPGGG
ncbi:hypothetical protein ACFW1I_30475, partial [Streptomyces sp. NPDC058955]